MTADQVKALLPVIEAFAQKRRVFFRDKRYTDEWILVNPETTEFRIVDLDPVEWRTEDHFMEEGWE